MKKRNLMKMAESFRHAIHYLMEEAHRNGFGLVGKSLEKAERAIDEELKLYGLSRSGRRDANEGRNDDLNRKP